MGYLQSKRTNRKRWLFRILLLLLISGLLYIWMQSQAKESVEQKREKAEELWAQGRELVLNGQLEVALAQLEQAVAIYTEIDDQAGRSEALFSIGVTHEALGNKNEAIEIYQMAAEAFDKSANPTGEAASYLSLTEIYIEQQAHEQALESSRKLLQAALEANAVDGQAAGNLYMGIAYYALGENERARERFHVAQMLFRNISDTEGEARSKRWIDATYGIYGSTGNVPLPPIKSSAPLGLSEQAYNALVEGTALYEAGKYQEAVSRFEEAFILYQQAGELTGEISVLNGLGATLERLERYSQALKTLNQAREKAESINDEAAVGRILGNIARIYESQDNLSQALDYYKQALTLSSESDDLASQAYLSMSLGTVYTELQDYNLALSSYEEALPLMRQIGDVSREVTTLSGIGKAYYLKGEYTQSLNHYKEALTLTRQRLFDRAEEGTILIAMARIYLESNEYGEAIGLLKEASEIAVNTPDQTDDLEVFRWAALVQEQGHNYEAALSFYQRMEQILQGEDSLEEAVTSEKIASVYFLLGQFKEAIRYLEQAQSHYQDVELWQGEARIFGQLAVVYSESGDTNKARESLQHAMDVVPPGEDVSQIPELLINMGNLLVLEENYLEALALLEQALQEFVRSDDKIGIAFTLNNMGAIFFELGEYQQAETLLHQGMEIAGKTSDWRLEKKLLVNLGNLYLRQGQNEKALSYYDQAINTLRDVSSSLMIKNFRVSFVNSNIGPYHGIVLALHNLGRDEEAFNYVEQAKARVFRDQLQMGVRYTKIQNPDRFQRTEDLRLAIAALEAQKVAILNQPSDQQDKLTLQTLDTELEAARTEFNQFLSESYLALPSDALTLEEVQATLDARTTLIEYFVTSDGTLVFIITDGRLDVVKLSVSEDELAAQIQAVLRFPTLNAHPQSLIELHKELVEPIEPFLKTPVVGVIPHGKLHYLPFAALTDGTSYFGDNYILFTLPSASVISFVQSKPDSSGPDTALILGAPIAPELDSLPFAAEEANIVAEIYNTQARIGDKATESWLKDNSGAYRILHLAAHAELVPEAPLLSSIRLTADESNDGLLYVFEVLDLDLKLKTDLVVLSACQTNAGGRSAGDDFVGLSQAFIEAGTPTVIASLWKVQDKATMEFMTHFYQFLQADLDKAAALQAAQGAMREKYPSPFYWAPFVLIGDPG